MKLDSLFCIAVLPGLVQAATERSFAPIPGLFRISWPPTAYAAGYTLSPFGLPANTSLAAASNVQLPFLSSCARLRGQDAGRAADRKGTRRGRAIAHSLTAPP